MSGEKRSTRFTEVKLLPAGIGGSERRWVVESNAERLVASSNEPDFALLPLSPRKARHCTRRVSRSPPSSSSSAAGWLSLFSVSVWSSGAAGAPPLPQQQQEKEQGSQESNPDAELTEGEEEVSIGCEAGSPSQPQPQPQPQAAEPAPEVNQAPDVRPE